MEKVYIQGSLDFVNSLYIIKQADNDFFIADDYLQVTSRLKDAMVFASKEDADKFITDKMLDNNWVVLEVI